MRWWFSQRTESGIEELKLLRAEPALIEPAEPIYEVKITEAQKKIRDEADAKTPSYLFVGLGAEVKARFKRGQASTCIAFQHENSWQS